MSQVFNSAHPLAWMFATPCGVYCIECNERFSADKNWTKHKTAKHPHIPDKTFRGVLQKLEQAIQDAKNDFEGAENDGTKYILDPEQKVVKKFYCVKCWKVCDDTLKKVKCSCGGEKKQGAVLQMKCKRWYPKERLQCIKPDKSPVEDAAVRTRTADRLRAEAKLKTNISEHCDKFQLINERFFSEGVVDLGDDPKDYHSIFFEWLSKSISSIGTEDIEQRVNNLKDEILRDVTEMDKYEDIIERDSSLSKMVTLFERFLGSMKAVNSLVPRNLKAALGTFELNEWGEATDLNKYSFRMRDNEAPQITEFKRLLVYLDKNKSPILEKYLKKMREDGHNYTVERGHQRKIIADLIYDLALEDLQDGQKEVHTYLKWVHTRCFKNVKGKLVLRSPFSNSSLWALALYILRAGTLTLLATPSEHELFPEEHSHKMNMVRAVSNCLPHVHSATRISQFRRVQSKRAPDNRTSYDSYGNVYVGDLFIASTAFHNLIPKWRDHAISVLSRCFGGYEWEKICKMHRNGYFQVSYSVLF